MGRVRGKLGGPYALFVHHSDQRHSDGSHGRKFSPLRRSLNCSCPPHRACVRTFQTIRLRNDSKRRFANFSCPVCTLVCFDQLTKLSIARNYLICRLECTKSAPKKVFRTRKTSRNLRGGNAANLSPISYFKFSARSARVSATTRARNCGSRTSAEARIGCPFSS